MNNEADFFVAGGTLRTSAPSYVTRPADAELLQQLQAGEFCYVLTPRQMGKSSLMVRTAQRLRAEGVRVVIIDLTSIGASSSAISADQWYLGLLSRIRSDLRLTTDIQGWWQAHSAFSVSQRFIDFLQQVVLTECADNVVILIDEIDSTLNLPFRDDFFAAIRAAYNERANNPIYSRLTFALFGVATPTDLIQDRERTPFNIGHRIDLREFTLADAEPLRHGLTSRLPEQANAIFQRIFYWTNGHPYLTQKLCHAVVLHTGEWREESIEQTVDQLVYTAFLSEEGRKDPNLTFVQDRILTSPEQEQRQMLRLYRRVRSGERVADDDRSLIQNRLELYGLVSVVYSMLQVRNRIYEQVFTPAWVDSVTPTNRRQRNALLAATIALLLVVGMSAFLLLQPDSTCSELQAQFEANATNSSIRISTLAGLIQRENTCGSMALDLFYNLEPQEQIALFVGLDNPANERTELETVIDKIYRTLDTIPEHDLKLMEIWLNVLQNAGVDENKPLVYSVRNWKEGRKFYNGDEYGQTIDALNKAIVPNHLVIYYDRALALIAVEDYDGALQDLNEIVTIAKKTLETPTKTPVVNPASPLFTPKGSVVITGSAPLTSEMSVTLLETTVPPMLASPLLSRELPLPTIVEDLVITDTSQTDVTYQQRFLTFDKISKLIKAAILQNPMLKKTLSEDPTNFAELTRLMALNTPKFGIIPSVKPILYNSDFECTTGYYTQTNSTGKTISVPDGWSVMLLTGTPTIDSTRKFFAQSCDGSAHVEKISGIDSIIIHSQDIETLPEPGKPFDVAFSQRISATVGEAYSLSGWFLSLCGGSATPSDCPNGVYIAKMAGIDPLGGNNPMAESVIWAENRRNFWENGKRVGWQQMGVSAIALESTITLFVRIRSSFRWHGNHAFIDAVKVVRAPIANLILPPIVTGTQMTVTWDGIQGPDIETLDGGTYELRFDIQYRQVPSIEWVDFVTDYVGSGNATFTAIASDTSYEFRIRARSEQPPPPAPAGVWPNHRYPGVWSEPVSVDFFGE
jgi:hypothetical protein